MKNFGWFLSTLLMFSGTNLDAHNLFRPLSNDTSRWSLVKWVPIPFRVQYHGFIVSTQLERYIFVVDGEIVYLHLHETAKQQFTLKQVLLQGQQVLIEDLRTHKLHILISGETAYVPNKFSCVLKDNDSEQQVEFSDTENRHLNATQEIFISLEGSNLHIWDISQNKIPMLYVISLK